MTVMSNLQAFIDIGFILLVTLSCCYALMREPAGADGKTTAWKEELGQVEQVLRRLVADASNATHSLDRHLSRRQEELTLLVNRIETMRQQSPELFTSVAQENAASARSEPLLLDDDLPNSTWAVRSPEPQQPEKKKITTEPTVQRPEVPSRAVSEPLESEPVAAVAANETKAQTLSQLIEVSQDEQKPVPADRIMARFHQELDGLRPAALDMTAYRIAIRLLGQGKEIHVVARKLSLPVSEVRILDRLVREDRGDAEPAPEHEDTVETARETDPIFEREISLV